MPGTSEGTTSPVICVVIAAASRSSQRAEVDVEMAPTGGAAGFGRHEGGELGRAGLEQVRSLVELGAPGIRPQRRARPGIPWPPRRRRRWRPRPARPPPGSRSLRRSGFSRLNVAALRAAASRSPISSLTSSISRSPCESSVDPADHVGKRVVGLGTRVLDEVIRGIGLDTALQFRACGGPCPPGCGAPALPCACRSACKGSRAPGRSCRARAAGSTPPAAWRGCARPVRHPASGRHASLTNSGMKNLPPAMSRLTISESSISGSSASER